MEIIDDRITLVTTDTHRLSVRKAFWQGNTDEEKISVIIPTKTMVEISRIISDEEEPITVIVGNNQVCFNIGTITFFSRLIEGQYPSYRHVIPDSSRCRSKVRIKTKRLLEATERASLWSEMN